jgi:hypothetical protein
LAVSNVWVGIRAEPFNFSVGPAAEQTLGVKGGTVVPDVWGAPTSIEVLYCATECAPNREFFANGTDGSPVVGGASLRLAHELAHVEDLMNGLVINSQADRDAAEAYAIDKENLLREAHGVASRTVGGGCRAIGGKGKTTSQTCFIATAAYDGLTPDPTLGLLQATRDRVFHTQWGQSDFRYAYEYYRKLSPLLIAAMEQDPRLKELVRKGVVRPIGWVAHLIQAFPISPLDEVPEPWRSFLQEMRSDLQQLVDFVPPREVYKHLSLGAAASELGATLRLFMRDPARRLAYLGDLVASNQLPLPCKTPVQRSAVRYRLQLDGLLSEEIDLVLGIPSA